MAAVSYKKSGVDIDKANDFIETIKPLAKMTRRPEVMAGIGGFGALFELSKKFKEPVLWSRSYFVTSETLPLESSSHSRPQTHAHVRAPAMLVDALQLADARVLASSASCHAGRQDAPISASQYLTKRGAST